MIKEVVQFLFYKSTNFSVSNDHLRESIALISRRKRNLEKWKFHEARCHEAIINFINENINAKKILILGSGILHEIPIEHSSFDNKEIHLVDVVHLSSVKKRVKNKTNIHFIEHEITETEKTILKNKKLIPVVPKAFVDDHFDLVISANLLSQLPIHLTNLILKNKIESDKIKTFCEEVVDNHIQYLKNFTVPTLIIFDKESIYRNHEGKIIESIKTIDPKEFQKAKNNVGEWVWNIAPIPELSSDYSMELKIVSHVINRP